MNIQISHDVYEKELRNECTTSQGFDESKYTARQNEDIENTQHLVEQYDNQSYHAIVGVMKLMRSYKELPLISNAKIDSPFLENIK